MIIIIIIIIIICFTTTLTTINNNNNNHLLLSEYLRIAICSFKSSIVKFAFVNLSFIIRIDSTCWSADVGCDSNSFIYL